jgi:hypothetical protein
MERHIEYYMGEGGGFPRVRAVVNLVSPELPVACPSIKSAIESDLTNLLVGFDVGSSKYLKFVTLLSSISELQHAPLPLLVLRVGSVPRVPHNFAV